MSSRVHQETCLELLNPTDGLVERVFPSWDNSSCVLIRWACAECGGRNRPNCPACGQARSQPTLKQFVFNGRICTECPPSSHGERFSLSFDGRRLASTQYVLRDGRSWRRWHMEVRLNGEPIWTGPEMFYIYHLDWLADGRLAWYGWFKPRGRRKNDLDTPARTYVDGQDVTGQLVFEPVLVRHMRHAVVVKENGRRYVVNDNGSVSGEHSIGCDCRSAICHCEEFAWWPTHHQPEEVRDERRGLVYVVHRGRRGPDFHAVEIEDGMNEYAFSDDGEHVAYIGVRYPGWAQGLKRGMGRLIEACDDNRVLEVLALPFAFLYSPYVGPLYAARQSSKRHYPTLDDYAWRKGYSFANEHFITPDGELVVTAYDRRGAFLVVDEDEGPRFNRIQNSRHIPGVGICYLAQRGDDIFRVVVRK